MGIDDQPVPDFPSKETSSSVTEAYWNKDYYTLSAEFEGTTRITLQQFIWAQALGFHIHPIVPKLSKNCCIADVACGTGSWLIQVSRQLDRTSDLHGFDINLQQSPVKAFLPENVNIHFWNIFDDVPPQFVGKFDFVHIGIVTVLIKENNPEPIIRNLYKLLKPGGWLQWDELDIEKAYIVKADPQMPTPGMDAWYKWQLAPTDEQKGKHEWKRNAAERLKKQGFAHVEQFGMKDSFDKHLGLMRFNDDQALMMAEQFAKRAYADNERKRSELLAIVTQVWEEIQRGAVMIWPPVIWVAQKEA